MGEIKTTKFTTESTADKMLSSEQPMLCEIERIFSSFSYVQHIF